MSRPSECQSADVAVSYSKCCGCSNCWSH